MRDAAAPSAAVGAAGDAAWGRGSAWALECRWPLRIDRHCPGRPLTVIVDTAEGKPASTSFRLLRACADGTSLVLCQLATGRTHQIRVHPILYLLYHTIL